MELHGRGRRGRPSRASLYAAVDLGLDDLWRVGGLPDPAEADAIWRGIWHEETHNSTAIEGNTLVLREVQTLLEQGRAVGDRELREYLEVQAYADAAHWVYGHAVGSDERSPGEATDASRSSGRSTGWWSSPSGRISRPRACTPTRAPATFATTSWRPFPGGMQPPAATDVPAMVDAWLAVVRGGPRDGQHLMEHLADVHARFEKIHPFRDGNGRTGRLVINLLLVKRGYPPAIIYNRERPRYIAALNRADRDGDVGALAELIARSVNDGINRFLLPALAGPQRLVPLGALTTPRPQWTGTATRGRARTPSRTAPERPLVQHPAMGRPVRRVEVPAPEMPRATGPKP